MSEILAREKVDKLERWQAPDVADADSQARPAGEQRRPSVYSARALEALQKQAWDEAWAEGLAAGRQAGEEEVQARARQLESLIQAMQQPLEAVDEEVESELVQLALAVARQIIRRELRSEPEHVIAAVREALAELPANSRQVRVHLHPEDAELVRHTLANPTAETSWELREDPMLERGGCRVSSKTASADATLETRLATVAARVLGGQRESDAPASARDPEDGEQT